MFTAADAESVSVSVAAGAFLPHKPASVACFGFEAVFADVSELVEEEAQAVAVVLFCSPEFLTRTIVPEYPNLVVEQLQNEV